MTKRELVRIVNRSESIKKVSMNMLQFARSDKKVFFDKKGRHLNCGGYH